MWDSDELTWFDNPPKRRRKLYGAAAKAHARKMAKRNRKKGARHVARKRSRRRKLYGAAAKAHARRVRGGSKRVHRRRSSARPRRRHRRSTVAAASRAGRVLRYRRPNPPVRGIINQLVTGAQDAAFIVLGKATTNIVAGFIPLGGGTAMEMAKKLGSALLAGYAGRFISPNASRMMLAGGLTGLIEGVVKQLNIPLIAPALSDYSAFPAVGSYPQVQPGVSAYPQLMAGTEEDEMLYQ